MYENKDQEINKIQITYYTDPLCCWSWGFEPQWRRLRYEFEGLIDWQYCMGGLIPDWNHFNDPMNIISRPFQMGALWMEARHLSGMPINEIVWLNDPPASSYPACIAYKCAEFQSKAAGELMLRKLREAVMIKLENIAKNEIIYKIAKETASEIPNAFNLKSFNELMGSNTGVDLLKADLHKISFNKIPRFPALTISAFGKPGIIIVGYRPYSVLLDALKSIVPDLKPVQAASSSDEYKNYWGSITNRELEEAVVATIEN